MSVRTGSVETTRLLVDLLAASERIYHRHVAVIQQAFSGQYLKVLHEHIGSAQIEFPDANPALLERRVRDGLRAYRADLRRKQDELIAEERRRREERERGIRAYVSSRALQPATAA